MENKIVIKDIKGAMVTLFMGIIIGILALKVLYIDYNGLYNRTFVKSQANQIQLECL